MKKILNIILIFSCLIIVSCHEVKNETKKQDHKTIFYTCSMDPQVKEDKPGKCPICHMELTALQENQSAFNEIKLSEQQILLGNIRSISIDKTTNSIQEKFTGTLAINQEKVNIISARVMGRIEKLYFKTVGDYISKNNPVYEIYSEDLAIAKQDYLSANRQIELPGEFGKNAQNIATSAKQKLLFYGLSEKQIHQIITQNDTSPKTTFYSAFSGYITEITIVEGGYAMEGMGLLKLAELNNLWLETQVNANYINKIRINQVTNILFSDFPDKKVIGKVSFINPEINPNTRLLLVRIEVPNNLLTLKPGMQGIVELSQSNLKGIFLPIDAIIREEKASYIWLAKENGVFENVMVNTGIETNGLIEIKSGVEQGQNVVISGAYSINSEYRFRKGTNPMDGMKM